MCSPCSSALLPPTVVRDPVHGLVELTADEWKAVDTPVFQRLRQIRQLALTYLVYPGAQHTRFEHSIGVLYIAGHLADKLKVKKDDKVALRAAALLHDVGHGVFSHVSDQVIEELTGAKHVHEAVSVYLLSTDEDLRRALGDEVADRAAHIVAERGSFSLAHDVVTGPTDADKLDYLLRDSYFCGVNYGRYDLDRLIDSARVIAPSSARPRMGFDADAVWAVEEMLMARHHMHRQVYGHKTRLATDIMLARTMKLAVDEHVLEPAAYRVEVKGGEPVITPEFAEAHRTQTDARVLHRLEDHGGGGLLVDLSRRLMGRSLLRRSAAIRIDERQQELGSVRFANIRDREWFRGGVVTQIEQRLATRLGFEPHLVALHVESLSNPTYRDPGPEARQQILFSRGRGQPRPLNQVSEIFRDFADRDPAEEHVWVYLYTPKLSNEDRTRARRELWSELKSI